MQDLRVNPPVILFFLIDYVYYAQSYELMIWVIIDCFYTCLFSKNSMT